MCLACNERLLSNETNLSKMRERTKSESRRPICPSKPFINDGNWPQLISFSAIWTRRERHERFQLPGKPFLGCEVIGIKLWEKFGNWRAHRGRVSHSLRADVFSIPQWRTAYLGIRKFLFRVECAYICVCSLMGCTSFPHNSSLLSCL